MTQFSELTKPGAYLVDTIPLCKSLISRRPAAGGIDRISFSPRAGTCHTVRYVPEWFPGAGWKKKAKWFAETLNEMVDVPHRFVKDQMVSRRSCWKDWALFTTSLHRLFPSTGANPGVKRIERPQLASTTWLILLSFDGDEFCTDIRYRRLLERLFRHLRPSSSAVRRSLQRLNPTSSGPLLLYIQVRLAPLYLRRAHRVHVSFACPPSHASRWSGYCEITSFLAPAFTSAETNLAPSDPPPHLGRILSSFILLGDDDPPRNSAQSSSGDRWGYW